ncbi:Serpentine Receptor, class U [Caenorhabditis elegans]|uniref:Serpentine Receptor, class U n=1 Tax=Caenorhabditis elegans TaxID=6239 RepID=O18019_CAEEL|nr:Serpentine Receptor, class U [Caenorhabditis elegans]CAB05611.1 Serpentine Receptor, class U [Caenorhabditis elegans]|eukprot:NP_502392.1 Serpentine Receptor, class U [Caenorhabditis elegans]
MVNGQLGAVVNENPIYKDFQFNPFTIESFLSFSPFIYIIPTFVIIFRIFRIFLNTVLWKKKSPINHSVFIVLVLSQISSLGFFLADLFVIRIPPSGIMTSWCYNQPPSHLLNLLFNTQAYFNYCVMLYPVLFSTVRLVITYFPNRHEEINRKILKRVIPLIHVYPLPMLFFMFPALGVCRQHHYPYRLGAVYVHFIGSFNGIMSAPITILNSAIWLTVCLILNWILYRKLRKIKLSQSISQLSQVGKSRKIEISLSLTTTAMFFAYTTNLFFLGSFIIDYNIATYLVVFRPFGYDLELCVVPLVFYFTHPAFKRKKSESRISVNPRNPGLST